LEILEIKEDLWKQMKDKSYPMMDTLYCTNTTSGEGPQPRNNITAEKNVVV